MKLKDFLREGIKKMKIEFEGTCVDPPFGWDATEMANVIEGSLILDSKYLNLLDLTNTNYKQGVNDVNFGGDFIVGYNEDEELLWIYYFEVRNKNEHDIHFFFSGDFPNVSNFELTDQNVDRGT